MSLFKGLDTPFFDSATGEPLAFGFVYFGVPNQDAITNPKVPYANQGLSIPLPATQELTIAGKFQQEVWLDGDYSVIITDANGVQQAEYLIVPQAEGGGGGGGAEWGEISGTLSDQTDLQSALDAKAGKTQTDGLAGYISTAENQDYTIGLQMPFAGSITSTTTQCISGTCTATFKINSTALGGTANSVSSTEQEQSHASSNSFSAGDNLVVTLSSNSSCLGLAFMVKFTRTLE